MQNSFKFPEHFKWILNVSDDFEVFIDVLLKCCFYTWHLNVEFNKITIEGVIIEIK